MILDKTQKEPSKVSAWGILGNPTPEKIKEWCDMPHGKFTDILKEAKKRYAYKKNVEFKDYTVYVIKTKKIQRVATVKVTAISTEDAYRQVSDIPESELTFAPSYEHKNEDSTCTCWKPHFLNLESVPNEEQTA